MKTEVKIQEPENGDARRVAATVWAARCEPKPKPDVGLAMSVAMGQLVVWFGNTQARLCQTGAAGRMPVPTIPDGDDPSVFYKGLA